VHAADPNNIFTGGYGINNWLYEPSVALNNGWADVDPTKFFVREAAISQPVKTPAFVDCIRYGLNPWATDRPAQDLYNGISSPEMGRCTIARHKFNNPKAAPRNWPPSQKLPAAVDIGFADGHVELVPLENLWQQYWHKDYQPPVTRPK